MRYIIKWVNINEYQYNAGSMAPHWDKDWRQAHVFDEGNEIDACPCLPIHKRVYVEFDSEMNKALIVERL